MTTEKIQKDITEGKEVRFYVSKAWKRTKEKVFVMDHYECQLCKAQGRFRRGSIIHHIKPLKERPDLALQIYDPETKERQLITVCRSCHEKIHGVLLPFPLCKTKEEPLTKERWD